MSQQIAVRLPEALIVGLDAMIERGAALNRAAAVRAAVAGLVDRERRHAVGEATAEGYRRMPQTDDEVRVAEAAALRSIDEEPW